MKRSNYRKQNNYWFPTQQERLENSKGDFLKAIELFYRLKKNNVDLELADFVKSPFLAMLSNAELLQPGKDATMKNLLERDPLTYCQLILVIEKGVGERKRPTEVLGDLRRQAKELQVPMA